MFIIRSHSRHTSCSLMISRTHLLVLPLCIILFNLLPQFNQIDCLQTSASQRQGSDIAVNSSSSGDEVASLLLLKSLSENNSDTSGNGNVNTSRDVTLLSSEEYVDGREVPAILIDGTSNETVVSSADGDEGDTVATTTLAPTEVANNKSVTIAPVTINTNSSDSSSQPKAILQGAASGNSSSRPASPTTTTAATILTTKAPEIIATLTTIAPVPTSGGNETTPVSKEEEDDEAVAGADDQEDDDANSDTTKETNQNDFSDNSKNNLTFEPPQNISQYMDYIERLFHDLKHQILDLLEPHIPKLIRSSQMVELSNSCSYDMLRMALALRQFEPWALRMIDSSGKMPEGIFEGSFTALGAYDECINTVFQSASSQQTASNSAPAPALSSSSVSNNQQADSKHVPPTRGKYCLVTVSPFMPPKPPADKVERMFQDEANRRNYTKDDQFSRLSPMFYYMKFRIGVCIPSTCSQDDMDSISGTLSSSLRLNITIPDCRVRQTSVALTQAQLTGGVVFAVVVALVVGATLADCLRVKLKFIRSQEIKLKCQMAANQESRHLCNGLAMISTSSSQTDKVASVRGNCSDFAGNNVEIRMRPPQLAGLLDKQSEKFVQNEATCESDQAAGSLAKFEQELNRNWSWMSFSLLTNFRLYFKQSNKLSPPSYGQVNNCHESASIKPEEPARKIGGANSGEPQISTINCLNGIRVLSLCWVILANSYLTLDPRVTKRLTKSREAPRDFFFQLVVQASLAIETFFFLSGLLMSLSFAKRLKSSITGSSNNSKINDDDKTQNSSATLRWTLFYVHRYVRMTPPTMLVIAFSMYAYHYGDGPLWFEATQRVHQSCAQNWWRHLLHVANFIDTRQMCFIHYWYIAADMQLFLFGPLIMFLLYKSRHLGYTLIALIGSISIGLVFYKTYDRSLPPTLLFYNTDPESRREFGNTIMTKPFTHVMPYLVGMLVGWVILNSKSATANRTGRKDRGEPAKPSIESDGGATLSLTGLGGVLAIAVAMAELFLPYKWNNSHLPSKLMASTYAALFRFGWSLVLAYIVLSCRHKRGPRCTRTTTSIGKKAPSLRRLANSKCCEHCTIDRLEVSCSDADNVAGGESCFCGSGGNFMNRLLSLDIFAHLSKLSFVAYLIHLPLMSVFIGQTRGLFAFSHTLVIHFAISYLVMTFVLSFILVHIIEFPFITFERHMFDRLLTSRSKKKPSNQASEGDLKTLSAATKHHSQYSADTATSSPRPRHTLAHQAQDGFAMRHDLYSNVTFGLNDSGCGCNNMDVNYRCQREPNMLDQTDLSEIHISERL